MRLPTTITAIALGAGASQLPDLPPEALGGAAVGLGTIALWRIVQLTSAIQAYLDTSRVRAEAQGAHQTRVEQLGAEIVSLLRAARPG